MNVVADEIDAWERETFGGIVSGPNALSPRPVSVLEEAEQIINGERRDAYGEVRESFRKVAGMWGIILGHNVTSEHVALMMIAFKLCREANSHKRDNLVDLAGYTALLAKLTGDSD